MEYNELNQPIDVTQLALQNVTERLNEQSRTIADLRSQLEAVEARLDEATHMTSEEYGAQVVEQVRASMPVIMAEATKAAKRGGRR